MNGEPLGLGWWRRLVATLFAVATVALALYQTRRIFTDDYDVRPVLGAAAAAGLVALLVSSLPGLVRMIAIAVSAGAGAAGTIVAAGGTLPGDLGRAPVRGISDLVGTVWPSPPLAAGVGAVALFGALCAGFAVELAVRHNQSTALVPSLAVIGLIAMLSAPAGSPPVWSIAAFIVAALGVLGSRTFAYRSSVTSLSAAVVTIVALAVPVVFGSQLQAERYDPREADVAPVQPRAGISPLARLDEWRSRTPPEPLFSTSLTIPTRWRLVGLTRYDGRTWLPADDYRRAGKVLTTEDPQVPTTRIEVEIAELDAVWLPAFDRTVSVTEEVRVDSGRSGLLANDEPGVGTSYALDVEPVAISRALLAGARAAAADSPFVDGFQLSPQLLELATSITAGARTDLERAALIESYLREEFVLDQDSPPGHSIAVLDLFIDRSRRGRDEQFVAAYGLLAAAVGLPVRIAVGFETVAAEDGSGTDAMSDRAIAWPEVEFVEFGWVQFDPVPTSTSTGAPALGDGAIAPTEDVVEERPPTTAATTTQTTLPDTSDDDEVVTDQSAAVSTTAVGVAIGTLVLVLTIVAYISLVVWAKSRRRRRRRRAADPRDRAVGAFLSSVEVLIDLGARAPRAATNTELVLNGAKTVGETAVGLSPVADLATEAVYSSTAPSTARADRSWATADQFEAEALSRVGRLRQLRARASLRSLRRRWR